MAVKLSILIATMPSRKELFYKLLDSLNYQLCTTQGVEILSDDSMSYNIGIKRNSLLTRAKGEYIVFIDDDDSISPNYTSLILAALESTPDCVAINGTITTNGKDEREWFISKEYPRWYTGRDGNYYRTPNHISPVRRELALMAGFPEIAHGEDAEYSRILHPLLKTETIIETPIYHYKYRNDDKK